MGFNLRVCIFPQIFISRSGQNCTSDPRKFASYINSTDLLNHRPEIVRLGLHTSSAAFLPPPSPSRSFHFILFPPIPSPSFHPISSHHIFPVPFPSPPFFPSLLTFSCLTILYLPPLLFSLLFPYPSSPIPFFPPLSPCS